MRRATILALLALLALAGCASTTQTLTTEVSGRTVTCTREHRDVSEHLAEVVSAAGSLIDELLAGDVSLRSQELDVRNELDARIAEAEVRIAEAKVLQTALEACIRLLNGDPETSVASASR